MDVTHCPELSPFSFLRVCMNTNSFIWATPLHGEAIQHIITHLLACFTIMGTPSSIKTDNGSACISRHFKQFLQSFPIIHITGIPYNPQTEDIVKQTHHIQIENLKRGNTQVYYCLPYLKQTLLDSNILSKPVTIVNTALFVLNF